MQVMISLQVGLPANTSLEVHVLLKGPFTEVFEGGKTITNSIYLSRGNVDLSFLCPPSFICAEPVTQQGLDKDIVLIHVEEILFHSHTHTWEVKGQAQHRTTASKLLCLECAAPNHY